MAAGLRSLSGLRPRLREGAKVLGVVLLSGWACSRSALLDAPGGGSTSWDSGVDAEPQKVTSRKVDIIFEIDPTDVPEQQNLAANFPSFIAALANLPGGLPDMHIGVITTDMGGGAFANYYANTSGCPGPDSANFLDTARDSTDPGCLNATLNAGEHFISSSNGGSQNNFTGDISEVFSCLAIVGADFCGFEQPFEAVRSALGDATGDPALGIPARQVPTTNTGFLRPDASLAVIFLNEMEECSSLPTSLLFDPNGPPSLGPLGSRCFSHADICDGQLVIDYVLKGSPAGPFKDCVPDETTFEKDPNHALIPVQFYVDYFKKLKNPANLLVAGIIPPPGPYSLVTYPDGSGGTFVGEGFSCQGAAGVVGLPVPRLTKFFSAFPQSVTTSVCATSFAPAMTEIATRVGLLLGP
jgi:hypothetical protein